LYEARLREKRIFLPKPPKPLGTYLPAVRSGNILFVSGMLPKINGKISLKGKLGRELNQHEGYEAARLCVINGLAAVKAELGNLERVRRVLKVVGYVASEEAFFGQPQVVNGASDLLVDIFGDNGKHARVAVGVAELPENVPVEIEIIFEIKNVEKEMNESGQDRISDHLLNRIEQKQKAKNRNRGPYRKATVA
jgi:enamine deaminase RidA (YjgF/YER057c/UK114 family)